MAKFNLGERLKAVKLPPPVVRGEPQPDKGFCFGEEAGGQRSACWPLVSEAMSVHPDQIREEQAHLEKLGVHTEFQKDGRPVFTDAAHRKRHCEALGYRDRNAGYGDPQSKYA